MPIYEYKCQACDHVFEDMVLSSRDTGPDKCPKCQASEVSRLISGTNFQLKGGGWFHSDYGKKTSTVGNDSAGSVAEKAASTPAAETNATTVSSDAKAPVEKASPAPKSAVSEPSL